MSATPNGLPHGQNPPPPGAAPLRRKKKPADPLVARKKPVAKPPPKAKPNHLTSKPYGAHTIITQPNLHGAQAPKVDAQTQESWKHRRRQNGGWWDPPPRAQDFREFPVYITKHDIKEGMRAHVMRFAKTRTGGAVDPTDQNDFARPITLHRKDTRSLAARRTTQEPTPTPQPVDEAEQERLDKIKAEKEAQRAVDLAQIAPGVKDTNQKRQNQKEKTTTQTYYPKRTDEQKKQAAIRYEESLQWVLEDADGKNTYVGHYVDALSESHVAFAFEPDNRVRLIPLEKFYRFSHRPPFQTYTLDEAEKIMSKKIVDGRWTMRDSVKKQQQEEIDATRWALGGRSKVKMESTTFRAAARSEKQEHDDIDFSGDEFQDDDENPTFEQDNDEEVKDARDRVRREQLTANLFGEGDEAEVQKEEDEELQEEEQRKRFGKGMQKALIKREKHLEYKSDPDSDNPWGSSSSDDDSDAENKDTNDVKNEEDDKTKPDLKSGTASKGSNTPSGKQKPAELKKNKILKRPASPNVSESSGNESSRKKAKRQATGSKQGSRSATPLPGSQRPKTAAAATSDGEATGGEMSEAGRAKKRLRMMQNGTHPHSTTSSRAGSPAAASGQQSPGSPSEARPSTPRAAARPVAASEIVALLAAQPNGITVGQLLRHFNDRVGEGPGLMNRRDWIKLVKENARWLGSDVKRLFPKEANPQQGSPKQRAASA